MPARRGMETPESAFQVLFVRCSVVDLVVPASLETFVASVRQTKLLLLRRAKVFNCYITLTDAVNQCGGTVTLNNTYWQSPAVAIKAPTICALNIKLDTNFVEQLGKPICQIR